MKRMESSVSIQMKKASARGRGGAGGGGGERITRDAVLDEASMANYVANAKAFQVLAPMRGSPHYWNNAARDLVSMIRQLGPCTFFRTHNSLSNSFRFTYKL